MILPTWLLTYDDENQEDYYEERPSEFIIRQTRRAAPDAWVRLYRLPEYHKPIEEWPPLDWGAS